MDRTIRVVNLKSGSTVKADLLAHSVVGRMRRIVIQVHRRGHDSSLIAGYHSGTVPV
jgi:hypothetical protein